MPTGIWNSEFRDALAQCRYPLADDATAVDTTGTFALPDDFLVGMDLPVNAAVAADPAGFYVMAVGSYPGGYSLVVGYDGGDGPVPVASATVPRAGHARNKAYVLGGLGSFSDTKGYVMVGRLESADEQPPGLYAFDKDGGRLDPDAVRPTLQGVSAVYLKNGSEVLGPFTGDVYFRSGTNFEWTVAADGARTLLVPNAVSGAGTTTDCACAGDLASLEPVTRINGVPVGPEFTLAGDSCYEFSAVPGGLKLSDKCSTPCCGCAELEAITRDLERYRQNQDTASRVLGELQSSVRQTELVVLGAKLGDRGCGLAG